MQSNEFFYVCNGAVLKDLSGLLGELRTIDEKNFSYHVNNDKNDFAKWVGDVLKEPELAAKLSKTKNKQEMVNQIEKRLKALLKLNKTNKDAVISKIKEAMLNG
jgi:hypothetical protein